MLRLTTFEPRATRILHLRQSDELQEPNVGPANVELEPLGGESRRLRIRMVVVMKLFTTQPNSDWSDVSALVLDLEIPIAQGVADAVHDAGSPEGDPEHLNAPNEWPDEESEQVDVDGEHDENAEPVEPTEDMPLEPVVRRALAVLLEDARLANRLPIVESALQENVPEPLEQRAVWVTFAIREGVVLPVACDPLFRDNGRGEPQPEAHGKGSDVVQPHAAVRLRSMEEERHADVGYVAGDDDEYDRHPPSSGQFAKPWHPKSSTHW